MKDINLDEYVILLRSTPNRVRTVVEEIGGLSKTIFDYQFEPDHFSIKEVIGHFIHGENEDWIPRLQLIIENSKNTDLPVFTSFDPRGYKEIIASNSVNQLINIFDEKRKSNLEILQSLQFDDDLWSKKAIHPSLGEVTVRQLLNTWVCHDLSHLNQINRTLSYYFREVGPWKEYLRILQD